MLRKVGAVCVFASLAAASAPAAAPELPEILTGPGNAVPACVTPGRLMAFLKVRNDGLQARYEGIATQYMRFGEQFGIRWDFAFYQMIVETGALTYWRGSRAGDVRPEQLNFAGLGATGKGERGESFKDIETGVRAHLEHLLLYAGRPVDNPVAERTRKVHQWGVLTAWQKAFNRPLTYGDLAARWAPGNRHYGNLVRAVAERFQNDLCARRDPRPELVLEARNLIAKDAGTSKTADATDAPPRSPGAELAKRAIEEAKADGSAKRSALGAQPPPSAPYKVLDPPPPPDTKRPDPATDTASPDAKEAATPKSGSGERTRTALAGAAATKAKVLPDTATPPAANQKCRVWTASYGGQKSVIIRSVSDQVVNFTVLDVNVGSEKREADAFIAAYAKNGRVAGEYANQAQALDKAFELCPEG
jgi:Mannosyl-glycoprotein endo-beta-N-acetylglucosaminidase